VIFVDPSDHRFNRWSSTLIIFAVSAAVAVAVGVITYQPNIDDQSTDRDVGVVEPAGVSPRCLEADRASVVQLATVLERNRPENAAILERANFTLSIARRHCLYGWHERALEDYEWLKRWLDESG
jgi:hypothetical protein